MKKEGKSPVIVITKGKK